MEFAFRLAELVLLDQLGSIIVCVSFVVAVLALLDIARSLRRIVLYLRGEEKD